VRRAALIAALLVPGWAAGASQPDISAEQRQACQGDYLRHCLGTAPGEGRVLACMAANFAKLSPKCAASLAEAACDPQTAAMVPLSIECPARPIAPAAE